MKRIAFAMVWALIALGSLQAQETKKSKKAVLQEKIKNLVDSQTFDFIAETALPISGRSRHLTAGYFLKVRKDSIIAELPYYGKAYEAPMNPSEVGIQFTSVKFVYELTNVKKGGWDIKIKPQDASGTQELFLQISSDGYASLQVTSTKRQLISFNGQIEEAKNSNH